MDVEKCSAAEMHSKVEEGGVAGCVGFHDYHVLLRLLASTVA